STRFVRSATTFTSLLSPYFFSSHAPASTAIYTLSLHDALPIWSRASWKCAAKPTCRCRGATRNGRAGSSTEPPRSAHGIGRRRRLGQGDEFLVVGVRQLHAPGAPVGLGLFDALLRGGDEIPLDEARAKRLAAEQHHNRGA